MAEIQFSRGIKEEVVPDVRVTRAKDGSDGRAIFYFEYPQAITDDSIEITGMYLVDEEGEIVTREVNGKFINGEPAGIEAILTMKSAEAFERFVRFMERYGEENGLGLSRS